jgi:Flp pilus assembly protein TadD
MRITLKLGKPLWGLLALTWCLFDLSIATAAPQGSDTSSPGYSFGPVAVEISVRESTGGLLASGAVVRLRGLGVNVEQTEITGEAGAAVFQRVIAGEYEVEVKASGHKTALEQVSVMGVGSTYRFFVYVQPEDATGSEASSAPASAPLMTPKLQGLIDKGLEKMRKKQFEAAAEEFAKAAKLAPGNPDVVYLWGMSYWALQNKDEAKKKFELAISLRPTHAKALVALGELQLVNGDGAEAAKDLEKAFQVDGADWRTHYLLAHAYVKTKELAKAEEHAARSSELAKERGAPVRLLLGKIQFAEGKRADAKQTFEELQRSFPAEPAAKSAAAALESIRKFEAEAAASREASEKTRAVASVAPPAIEVAPVPEDRTWAPPDVDSKEYLIAQSASCKDDELMANAQRRMKQQLANFEKFAATEQIEHIPVDARGVSGASRTKQFSYLVFVKHVNNDFIYLEEMRDGGTDLSEFPTQLATTGLVSMGVALLDKQYQDDFEYKCEGLTQWRGKPAWQIHWIQRQDKPGRILLWRNVRGLYPIALRGRLWISANTFDLLHLETDLRDPVQELELTRDHLIVDYGPVKFENGRKQLWLPWHAEMYMELHGKRYHHKHTLSNYVLFSVDSTHKVAAPKQPPPTPEEH